MGALTQRSFRVPACPRNVVEQRQLPAGQPDIWDLSGTMSDFIVLTIRQLKGRNTSGQCLSQYTNLLPSDESF